MSNKSKLNILRGTCECVVIRYPHPTCLSFKLQYSQETVIPTTGNETLVFVPGDTFQVDIVGDGDLDRNGKHTYTLTDVLRLS